MADNRKILITSALPYVNNVPHLGNIIGCVLSADVFARYCKARDYDSLYICGTDEYGTATEIKALEEGLTPKEICDKYNKIHKEIYEWFGIKFDKFGRTSTEHHTKITQDIFLALQKNGNIIEEEVEQFYDEKAGMFLADRYIEGTCPFCNSDGARSDQCDRCGKLLQPNELIKPISKVTKTVPVMRKTKHLFINLPGIERELAAWIDKASVDGFWSQNSINIARAWLKDGLKKRAITRDLKWGVPVPMVGWENKVFYVWFEAPIGYISITANLTDRWKEWWMAPDEIRLFQFMGKDNVPFHTVIFPSTLMGTKQPWTLLHHISTTEFLNYEGGKFSKSRHVGVFGDDAKDSGIQSDVWRYYLLANRPEQADTMFAWEDFMEKNNSELLANLGNLVNRTLVFLKNNYGGNVPQGEPNEADKKFLETQRELAATITGDLEKVKLKDALHKTMNFSKNANRYFQDNKPWELVKKDKPRADVVMGILACQIYDLSILIEPHLPATSAEIRKQMSLQGAPKWADIGKPLLAGHPIGDPKTLFRKIEPKEIEALKAKFAGKKEEAAKALSFSDLDLEVGEILSVEKHPDAEKLFVEKVRLSDGERQIVSGLAGHYLPEELVGKKVVIVKNLAHAKLRGVESQGMLLAAEGHEMSPPKDGKFETEKNAVEVIFCHDNNVGEKVLRQGEKSAPKKTITINEFRKIKIDVRDFAVVSEGKQLVAGNIALRMKDTKEGEVC
jgi:methionyl-tRNA synthetase